MRNSRLLVACLVLGLSAGAAEAKLASVTSRFEVQGMVCESCARDVREGLSKLPGVRGIAVDVKTGIVTVIYEAKRLNARRIAKAIDDYGFTVRDLTR